MTEQGATVNVAVHDALPDVIAGVRRIEGDGVVHLTIPAGSALFLTATEFRALKDALQGRPVVIVTDDPLRRQLAGMFGLAGSTGALPVTPLRIGSPAGASRSDQTLSTGRSAAAQDRQEADASGDQTPARSASPLVNIRDRFRRDRTPPPPGTPPPLVEERSAESDRFSPEDSTTSPSRWSVAGITSRPSLDRLRASLRWHPPTRRGARPSGRMVAAVLGVVLIAAALGVGAAILLLPRATVAVTLKQQPVRGELVYAILPAGAEPSQGVDVTISGQTIEQDVTYEASIPTTGTRVEPDAPASGTVRLSNPNREEIRIDAGDTITSDDGITYAFAKEVVVPPAVPDEDRFGAAAATVEATEGGTAGNLDTGELSGQLDSGVYYSNRDGPIAGGTDKTVPTVAAEDLATLREQATAELPSLAEREVATNLAEGIALVPGSLELGEPTTGFDRGEGEDAQTVAIRATAPVTALTYRPTDAAAQATSQLRDELAAQAATGYALDPASLQVSEPTAVAGAGESQFRITAEGRALAAFPETERDRLARALAGKAPPDAKRILREQPGIEQFRITYAPDWLPDRMPSSAGRIDLNITG